MNYLIEHGASFGGLVVGFSGLIAALWWLFSSAVRSAIKPEVGEINLKFSAIDVKLSAIESSQQMTIQLLQQLIKEKVSA